MKQTKNNLFKEVVIYRKSNHKGRKNQQTNSDENNSEEVIPTDRTIWKKLSQNTSGRLPMHNVLHENAGPSSYTKKDLIMLVVLGTSFFNWKDF